MKIIPQSIVGRVTWLVAFVGLLSFLMHLLVVASLVRPLFNDMTSAVAGQVILVKALVTQANPTPTPQAIQKNLPPNMQIFVLTKPLSDQLAEPPRIAQSAIAPMRDKLPADIRLGIPRESSSELQKQLLFDFDHKGQTWRISYDVFPPVLVLLGSILGWLSLVALGVFASLYVGVRLVTRPMSEVAERLAVQGHGIQPLPQPKHAAREVRAMVQAFNQLVDEVKSADARKMQMLAGLSHDLRTPLTRLRLRAETRFEEPDAEAYEQDISAMQKMIDQFMAYVHGNARGRLGELQHVTEQIIQVLQNYSDEECSAQLLLDDSELKLPETAFKRLLTNLIDNALAYGGAPVRLVLVQKNDPLQATAALTVYDQGAGMSAREFEQALQPFVRLSESNEVGHSGLGLAIVAQIADQFGGNLQVVSQTDQLFGIEFSWPIQKMPALESR
jgi:two-component system, OmpR family, osmolarity sensor histidine kinase EnvZ